MIPDDFLNDTTLQLPQSWNLYSYVRNNPTKLIDPTGEKAKVTINSDKKTKTGTIIIEASFAIYAAEGQGITDEQLAQQKKLIEDQIKSVYSGQIKGEDGVTYEITAKITVEVKANEKEAKETATNDVAGNIVEIGSKEVYDEGNKQPAYVASYHVNGENFDRMKVGLFEGSLNHIFKTNVYAHEFSHLLGSGEHPSMGNVSTVGENTLYNPRNRHSRTNLNMKDFQVLFSPQVKQAKKEASRQAPIRAKSQIKWMN